MISSVARIWTARNGRGYRFRTGKANPDEIRIMGPDPNHGYPKGYVRFYLGNLPVNPNTGKRPLMLKATIRYCLNLRLIQGDGVVPVPSRSQMQVILIMREH
jgi:hypothetical protein